MIELQHLTKSFATQGGTVVALNDINLTIRDATSTASSVCRVPENQRWYAAINMLERPDEGNVIAQRQADAGPARRRPARGPA